MEESQYSEVYKLMNCHCLNGLMVSSGSWYRTDLLYHVDHSKTEHYLNFI
jgi:hypothetical protein